VALAYVSAVNSIVELAACGTNGSNFHGGFRVNERASAVMLGTGRRETADPTWLERQEIGLGREAEDYGDPGL
jgi:hypothetical protein